MEQLKLELGKTYRSRNGSLVRITSEIDSGSGVYNLGYRFVGGSCGQYYTESGKSYVNDDGDNEVDLVEEVSAEELRIDEIKKNFLRLSSNIQTGKFTEQNALTHYPMTENLARIYLSAEAGYSIDRHDVAHDCSVLAKYAIAGMLAAYEYGRSAAREEIVGALKPFAREADQIEKDYGDDLPRGQLQFPKVTMGELRYARTVFKDEKKVRKA
jgi:hypothetical protein